jgi:hypothetical protein
MKKPNFNNLFSWFIFSVCIAYYCTLPFGPSLFTFLGIKLDVALGFFAFLVSLGKVKLHEYNPLHLLVVFWFLFFYGLTVLFNLEQSNNYLIEAQANYLIRDYFVSLGNIIFSFTSPVILSKRLEASKICLLIASIIAALLIIFNFGAGSVYGGARVSFSVEDLERATDPNTISMGICICAIFSSSLFDNKDIPLKMVLRYLYYSIIAISVLLIASRTAILSLVISLFLTSLLLSRWGRFSIRLKNIFPILAAIFFVVLLGNFANAFYAENINFLLERFSLIGDDSRSIIFQETLSHIFSSSTLGFMIGDPISDSNPHNEILFHWYRTGLIGVFNFILVIASYYYFNIRKISSNTADRFIAMWLFVFIFLCIQTYWATKNLWLALALVNVLFLKSKRSCSNTTRSFTARPYT